MNWEFLNLEILQLLSSGYIGFSIFTIAVLILFHFIFNKRLLKVAQKFTSRTATKLDDRLIKCIKQGRWFSLIALELYFIRFFFDLEPSTVANLNSLIFVTIIGIGVVFGLQAIEFYRNNITKYYKQNAKQMQALSRFISWTSKFFLFTIATILILANLGYDVNSLLTGLGIGGVAIAFAVKSLLEDIFSALAIYFDAPFTIEDLICIDGQPGYVTDISMHSTKIRTLDSGQILVIPNRIIANSKVENYTSMTTRRIEQTLKITPTKDLNKLKVLTAKITDIVNNIPNLEFIRCHLLNLGQYSFEYEIVYNVNSPEYTDYANVQEKFNYQLLETLHEIGLELALPTQTLHLNTSTALDS